MYRDAMLARAIRQRPVAWNRQVRLVTSVNKSGQQIEQTPLCAPQLIELVEEQQATSHEPPSREPKNTAGALANK